jgi:hypothetical protein
VKRTPCAADALKGSQKLAGNLAENIGVEMTILKATGRKAAALLHSPSD